MPDIEISIEQRVCTLSLNRPEKKNAITDAMYLTMAEAIASTNTDPAVRVLLLRGQGDDFTAGNDLADFARVASGAGEAPAGAQHFLQALLGAEKPVVAAVQGVAVGVGLTMLLHCDQVLVAEGAALSAPFVNLALVPEAASSLLLQQRIGYARAFSVFGLGQSISAAQALAWGIASHLTTRDELASATAKVVARLCSQPASALRKTKALMRDHAALAQQMQKEGQQFVSCLRSPEAKEAMMAFAQRRKADFSSFS